MIEKRILPRNTRNRTFGTSYQRYVHEIFIHILSFFVLFRAFRGYNY